MATVLKLGTKEKEKDMSYHTIEPIYFQQYIYSRVQLTVRMRKCPLGVHNILCHYPIPSEVVTLCFQVKG